MTAMNLTLGADNMGGEVDWCLGRNPSDDVGMTVMGGALTYASRSVIIGPIFGIPAPTAGAIPG
jgi:hypothetical protein